MLIRVQYNDDKYDYVPGRVLNEQIALQKIKRFYRHSEERWITIGVDRTRGMGGTYDGTERRLEPAYAATMGAS